MSAGNVVKDTLDVLSRAAALLRVGVRIEHEEKGPTAMFSLYPRSASDASILIGSKGSVAKAIRTVVEAIGRKHGRIFVLDVSGDPDEKGEAVCPVSTTSR